MNEIKAPAVVYWHGDHCQRPVLLVGLTDKVARLVYLDSSASIEKSIRLVREPLVVRNHKTGHVSRLKLRQVLLWDKPYSVRRAVAHYRRMAKTWGISKNAKKALAEATR